jgi:type II secretory pathway component GspD/PulD (secretin)
MNRLIAILSLAILTAFAVPADPPVAAPQTVSISSKGTDVRAVLHDVFTQSNKNYVLEPNVRFVLYLSVKDVEFEEALQIVCKMANLDYELQNGIYYVGPKKQQAPVKPEPKPEVKPPVPVKKVPTGTLPSSVLQKRVTTKLAKMEFSAVAAEMSKQTGVTIELDPTIAKWKLDAYFNGSSLKYVLDTLSEAGGLEYKFTDHLTIEIAKPAPKVEKDRAAFFRD